MAAPLIWAGAALAGLYLTGRAIGEAGDAADSGAEFAKYAAICGGLYVSYRALKSAGVLK